jgi:ABC-2 type transport system permease protein
MAAERRVTLPPPTTLVAGQVAYHAQVLLRTPRAVVGGVLLPVILVVLRTDARHLTPGARTSLVAGLAVFGVLSTAYVTHAASLVAARQAGILKRWRAAPLPAWCFFAGRIAATTLLATTGGVLTAAVGSLTDHLALPAAAIAELVGVLLLGAATWASIGTAVSALIPTVEAAWPLLGLSYLPAVILSGSFGSVGGEPHWLATAIGWLPVAPIIHGAARALPAAGGASVLSLRDLALLAGWAAAGVLVSQRHFRWQPRTPGRRRASPAVAPTV